MIAKGKRGTTLKLVGFRVPRDFDHRITVMAQAQRCSRNSIIYQAIDEKWARFKRQQIRAKELDELDRDEKS